MKFRNVLIIIVVCSCINNSLPAQDQATKSPTLHQAVLNGDIESARQLISKGANVNENVDGMTPLHSAAEKGNRDIVQLLIENRAVVNARGNQNWTPLHLAATAGKTDIVELLVSKGADVNARDLDGRTPLWWAQARRHNQVVQLLIKHGAKQQVFTRTAENSHVKKTAETQQQPTEQIIDINSIKNIDPLAEPNTVRNNLAKSKVLDDAIKKLESESQNEIAHWNDGLTDCSPEVVSAVYEQIGAEFEFVRKNAVEESAEKTITVLDGLLLDRKNRLDKIVEKIQEDEMRREAIESRREGRTSRRSTRRTDITSRSGFRENDYDSRGYTENVRPGRRDLDNMITRRPLTPSVTMKLPFVDPNKVEAKIKTIEGLETELTAIDKMALKEMRGWTRSQPETSPVLAKAVYEQVALELGFVRKIAVSENAPKTTLATDGLLVTRQQRLEKIGIAMLEEKKKLRTELRTEQRSSRIKTR